MDRKDVTEDQPATWIDCLYGEADRTYKRKLHATLQPALPIVQCGYQETPDGKTFGCSSPKPNESAPENTAIASEPVSDHTDVMGFRLGWTIKQVNTFATAQGFSNTYAHKTGPQISYYDTDGYEGYYRQDTAITIVFDQPAVTAKEIILTADWQNADQDKLYAMAVKRFGLDWKTDQAHNFDGLPHLVWSTPDGQIVVEFWPDNRPLAPASLHLIDKRN